ncbi:ABC transporter ATP-binding protein [Syntrophobacter fumaroxidans]|uniref:Iron-regulated ABC transporter ATPase subunit SufC n=1 Tax=Syntrophobacter fumaroxidans (strain DSM 10017 / MPOB) TaxID=335543 RepID=A0LEL4_SYNFM|nr:ABC transporter ATP-binding protein [Syntrophobacter fumaroxidans]ABK15866.1 Iron-regulated ABC transporter ATPase subunit SufC [Syntrophobacter fumaroxidans MPOB]
MLLIEDLQVELAGQVILKHIDLEIKWGETHVLFGPNGSGKTSLLMTIMGYPQYKVIGGRILFKGVDITYMPINERARLGIGMSYQRPPTIHGLRIRDIVGICARREVPVEDLARRVDFEEFLDRDVNAGFSGGEIKRSELLQLLAQNPDLMLFDEPESGVDLENIALVGNTIAELLQKELEPTLLKSRLRMMRERTKMGLIITHTGYILDYVEVDKGQVLYDGVLSCSTNPREILRCIGEMGYEECVRCTIDRN